VKSPSAINVVSGTSLEAVQSLLNSDSNYPLYQETGFDDINLYSNQVSNWNVEGGDWISKNETLGNYTFVATYEFPADSRLYADINRTKIITIEVIVTVVTEN